MAYSLNIIHSLIVDMTLRRSKRSPERNNFKNPNQDTLVVVPGQDTGAGIDVDGGVGKAIQQELLVDDVLTCRKYFVSIVHIRTESELFWVSQF